MSDTASAIKAAEAALDKGDYAFCIKIIEPLLLSFPEKTMLGAQLRLLEVTAHIGRGEEQKAINICKVLVNSKEANIRQQAKQLLSILDAPCLPRPSNWSVEIPRIELEEPSLKSSFSNSKKKKQKIISAPPTGPTKNLDLGFSLITLIIIILITFLLSGCVNIATNLSISGADRLQISLNINSNSGKALPWQMVFSDNLAKEHSVLKIVNKDEKNQHFESPTIRFEEINELLQQITTAASNASGFNINKPEINVSNKSWIIGTKQKLNFYFDLSDLPKIPGLKINIIFNDLHNEKNITTQPLKPTFTKNEGMSLPLQIGEINKLEVSYWKWNKISVGIIFIIIITLLSISLQRFSLKMGFGFPELPP
tara:strand:+ start:2230 stop:3333 length:1104 start_codon:yes stop_codon:yes gene_type:complete